MDIGDMVGDAIKYPSQDWKKFAIFVVIVLIYVLIGRVGLIGALIGLIISFLIYGYILRAIKASLAGADELPEFDEIAGMIIDGIKVLIVGLIYAIPAIIIIILSAASFIAAIYGGAYTGALSTGGLGLLGGLALIGIIVALLYMLLIGGPLSILAIANMAYYDGEFGAAFRFSEIKDHISRIGLADFIIWYIVMIISGIVAGILGAITLIGWIITVPYFYLYFARSVALLVTSTGMDIPEAEAVSPGK